MPEQVVAMKRKDSQPKAKSKAASKNLVVNSSFFVQNSQSSILNTAHKIQLFNELVDVPGVTKPELLAAIQASTDNINELTADDILLSIITRRQVI